MLPGALDSIKFPSKVKTNPSPDTCSFMETERLVDVVRADR